MSRAFSWLFKPDEDTDLGVVKANQVLEAERLPWFSDLIAWLDAEADKPLAVGGQIEMIRSAERINTFKEIKNRLKRDVARAREVLEMERNDV